MAENLRHWDALSKTDPEHTKSFKRAGGFSGTAIKPIWSAKMMTAHFGPCGSGWGMEKPEFTTMTVGDEILVYCTVALWYREEEADGHIVFGVGGDKVAVKRNDGKVVADDEAFKKAYTDALSNAMKQIGVGADVHMGLFDDAKYVNKMRQEFAEDAGANPPANTAKAPTQPQTARKPTPGKFELLFPNGEIMAKFDTPDEWFHGLREAITQDGAMVRGLWERNEPIASTLANEYPDVLWAGKNGAKHSPYDMLAVKVRQLLSGIAA